MKFSIIIPSWNNLDYLKICINSIKKNSRFNHDINVHLNEGTDGSVDYLKKNLVKYKISDKNIGLCKGANSAASMVDTNYLVYSHDDMYFLPDWDFYLSEELKKIDNNLYYISGTMLGPKGCGFVDFDCGKDSNEFNEEKLLNTYKNINYFDHQGSHWAPHLIHKSLWDKVGGFSEEFDPGFASDTDLNMKLWNSGVRLFKGLNNFKVYHFGSITTRKKKNLVKNKGNRLFLKKWKISSDLFIKFYLKSNTLFNGKLEDDVKITIKYLFEYIRSKSKLFILKLVGL